MNFKRMLMTLKMYFDRGRNYANIISFVGTIFLVIAQLKLLGLDIDVSTYTIPILAIGFLGIIFLGWIEVKLNIFSEELNIRSWKNPVIVKQFGKYDEINKKLDMLLEMKTIEKENTNDK